MDTLATLTPEIQKMVEGYKRQQARCNKWKKAHPEQNCAYANKYYHQMKEEDPIKYREYLDKQNAYYKAFRDEPENVAKRKLYYENVIKPKKAAKAAEKAAEVGAAQIIAMQELSKGFIFQG